MPQATLLWSLWQRLLQPFAAAFTRPSYRRLVEWVTALALNVEEHTITQSVVAIERTADWKALESFAEYAVWKPDSLTRTLSRLVDKEPGRTWHGYRISAVDDTKVHRSGEHVWGTCTFHEYTARCPNRATTVRTHNWVCLGALLRNEGKPAWYLPVSGRLYFRKSQLPFRSSVAGPREVFQTKCELAVALLREQARIAGGPRTRGSGAVISRTTAPDPLSSGYTPTRTSPDVKRNVAKHLQHCNRCQNTVRMYGAS